MKYKRVFCYIMIALFSSVSCLHLFPDIRSTVAVIVIENETNIDLYLDTNMQVQNTYQRPHKGPVLSSSSFYLCTASRVDGYVSEMSMEDACTNLDEAYFAIFSDAEKQQLLRKWLGSERDMPGKQFFNFGLYTSEDGGVSVAAVKQIRYIFHITQDDISQ